MKTNEFLHLPTLGGKLKRFVKRGFRRAPRDFWRSISGVIHVGANSGQERELYAHYDLDVVWIEPIPDIFTQLKENIRGFPRQRAFQYLVTDEDNREYTFNIANNDGQSSSILDFDLHKDIWADIKFDKSIVLKSIRLDTLVKTEKIDTKKYNALIMDTQGTELLVLKGAENLLSRFQYIITEAADFEVYKNCCQIEDIKSFLKKYGFKETNRQIFASRAGGGDCFDVIFKKTRRLINFRR